MAAEALTRFNEVAIRSRGDLLRAIDAFLAKLQNNAELGAITKSRKIPVKRLLKKFREELENISIPFLDQPFQAYEINIADAFIELNTIEYSELSFDSQGSIDSSTCSVSPPILRIFSPYITPEAFAKRCRVKAETVQKWIEHRALKNLHKTTTGWLVAETQGKPQNDRTDGYYLFRDEGDFGSIIPEYQGFDTLCVFPDYNAGDQYVVRALAPSEPYFTMSKITSSELEDLESILIGNPSIVFQSTFSETISDRSCLFDGKLSPDSEPVKEIIRLIEEADLPANTSNLLKTMISQGKDEELMSIALATSVECIAEHSKELEESKLRFS